MKKPITPQERYDYAVEFVLKHEGGLVDHKKDPGGITNMGVSLRFLKGAGIDIDGDGDCDEDDIRCLTREQAKEIYKKEFWDKNRYEAINEIEIAKKVFDISVNAGARRAHRIVQSAANCFLQDKLAVDGILGGMSFGAINKICSTGKAKELYREIQHQQKKFYSNLIAAKPELRVFQKGWMNRANA